MPKSPTHTTMPTTPSFCFNPTTIESLDINDIEAITDWHERFFLHVATHPYIDSSNEASHYLSLVGKDAYRLLKDLTYPTKLTTLTVKDMQATLEKHLRPRNFEVYEREKFHTMQKKPDESYKNFILRVQRQASKCNFGSNLDLQLRDRLVAGITDLELKRRLLKESKLTLHMAKQILEDYDAVNAAVPSPNSIQTLATRVQRSSKPQHPQHSTQRPRAYSNFKSSIHPTGSKNQHYSKNKQQPPSRTSSGLCDSCGGSHLRRDCKFRQAICNFCKRKGHIQRVCRAKQCTNVNAVMEEPDDPIPVFTMQSKNQLHQILTFENGKQLSFILDTGSPVTFLPLQSFLSLGFKESTLETSTSSLKGVSGHELPVIGKFSTKVRTDSQESKLQFMVIKEGPQVLGLDGLRSLRVDIVLQIDQQSEITTLIAKCNNNKGGMHIEPVRLEHSGQPTFAKARPIPYGLRSPVKKTLDDLIADGILQPVASSAWASPIVTPLKTNGLPRVCGDFRQVNHQLQQTATSTTPEVEDMFRGLEGSQYFSKIDLSNAFLQIPLHESAYEITTINTPWGLFQHRFLPFGLHVSSSIFQTTIDRILNSLPGARAYQDDIIIHGSSKEEHDRNLLQVLNTLNKHNVAINANKSQFNVKQLKYLGYIINREGITADIERIKALQLAPKPQSPEQLRSFLGLVQFYSRFIPNFSALTQPLYELLQDFQWNSEADKHYDKVLHALINGKVLTSYKLGAPTCLIVDASEHALGAVLEQNGKPVTCISRKLSTTELHYSQTQKEALAVHWAVRRLHKFLFGIPFTIITDHRALEFIFNPNRSHNKATSNMLQRWSLELSGYNYTISHRPGKEIPNADFLSRHAFSSDPEPYEINFVEPLPISRNKLIEETKTAYGSIIAALRNGWSPSARRRFPKLHSLREDLRLLPDGTITFHDRLLIPPSCRKEMLSHLHMSHLGRDKMLSLARMLCWWPSFNQDLKIFLKECRACSQKPRSHPNWSPWPIPFQPMQRIHADYCGPFLGTYWALVVEDAYSKFPEVFLTKNPTAEFTRQALQKLFAREGIPMAIVTDNGTHFSAKALQDWLRSLGCTPVFTPPRHPKSNGQAENFVRTLKSAITAANPSTYQELDRSIDTFLLQYRNATHSSTHKAPAMLFKNRLLRFSTRIETTDVWFFRGNNSRFSEGLVLSHIGNRLLNIIDKSDGSVHRRHIEQVTFTSPESSTEQITYFNNNSNTSPSLTEHNSTSPADSPISQSPRIAPTSAPAEPATQDADPADAPLLRRSSRVRRTPSRFGDYLLDGEEL